MLKDFLDINRANPWKIDNDTIDASSMPLVMGIVNTTPDSFFDGGKHNSPEAAYDHSVMLLEQGATILDIGGESSRPGSAPVSVQEELDRVCPVVEALAQMRSISDDLENPGSRKFYISVDTVKAKVARECMRLGAHIINDISACSMDPDMLSAVAQTGASVVLNHMRGSFGNMQNDFKPYANVVEEVKSELFAQVDKLLAQDNIDLMKAVDVFAQTGYPVLIGTSRKSYIGKMPGLESSDRLIPTVTAGIVAAIGGASVIRVHDVREAKESILYLEALRSNGTV